MTRFSFEVPIKHLEEFDDLQDFYFMLSLLYKSSKEYRNFHDKKPKEFKWLDNSYNEQMFADSPDELARLGKQADVCKVVSPDNPKWSTREILCAFLAMRIYYSPEELIVVVNSEAMYKEMLNYGAKNFAISYWTRPKNFGVMYDSIWLSNLHFLGLLSLTELTYLKPPTCDTSMPIKLAMIGQTMEDWLNEGTPHINTKDLGKFGKSFFDAELDKDTLQLARENIIWLKEKVNG